jgi:hypothetical protein
MYGKFSRIFYGWDRLSKITIVVGILLLVTGYAWTLGAALIIYSFWRNKSTSVGGRNNEKFVFENMERNFYYKISNLKQRLKLNNIKITKNKLLKKLNEKRRYIVTSCPKCSQKLRLPRGKGKIIVTCSKCCSEFRLKT